MGKLIYASNMSLDGYTEDERGAFDWAPPDDDVFAFITGLMRSAGTYLYGRRMYETLAVWETDYTLAAQSDLMADYAGAWQAADKVVYSSTLAAPTTANTRLERHFDPSAVHDLKDASSKDLLVGGPNLRSAGARRRAGRRGDPLRLASRPRRAQPRTADRHARRSCANRGAPIRQWRHPPPLPAPVATRRSLHPPARDRRVGVIRAGVHDRPAHRSARSAATRPQPRPRRSEHTGTAHCASSPRRWHSVSSDLDLSNPYPCRSGAPCCHDMTS